MPAGTWWQCNVFLQKNLCLSRGHFILHLSMWILSAPRRPKKAIKNNFTQFPIWYEWHTICNRSNIFLLDADLLCVKENIYICKEKFVIIIITLHDEEKKTKWSPWKERIEIKENEEGNRKIVCMDDEEEREIKRKLSRNLNNNHRRHW